MRAKFGAAATMRVAARSLCLSVLALGLAACGTVLSVDSKRVGASAEKVREVHVAFDQTQPTTRAMSSGPGILALGMVLGGDQTARSEVTSAAGSFQLMFSYGFREQFPAMAQRYGLTVSPTAPAELKLQVIQVRSTCTGRCQSRATLAARLYDAGRALIWQFEITAGQANTRARMDEAMFEAFANELLVAMKKDGVIAP